MGKICDSLCGEKNNSEQNTNGQTQTNNDIEKNDANINNNAPKLKQYNPKLLESLYSKRSIKSSQGEEILIQGGQINPDYKYNFIKHYYGKSVQEFVEKMNRGDLLRGDAKKVIEWAI